MGIKVAQVADGTVDAGAKLAARLGDPAVVVYFASPKHDPESLAAEIARFFPAAETFGCTTAGELVTGAMTKGAIVAMGFAKDVVSRAVVAIDRTFSEWDRRLGQPMLELDPERWVGLVLVDGFSGAEERVTERIGDLTNVVFIGGSAGDDVAFKQTFVAADGGAASNAAVLALLECPNGFDVLKTQSFEPPASSSSRARWTRRPARSSSSTASPPQSPMPRPSESSPTSWPTSSWPTRSA
jgi:hypothetical protein